MNNNKKTLKSIVFSMVLAAGMLLPASGFAQERGGGLFGLGDVFESDGWFRGALNTEDQDPAFDLTVNSQDFGQDAPLGSGIVILLAAGAGYAAFKRKEELQ